MQHTNNTILPTYTEVNGITYQLVGDVYFPLIAADDKPRKPLGYWGITMSVMKSLLRG